MFTLAYIVETLQSLPPAAGHVSTSLSQMIRLSLNYKLKVLTSGQNNTIARINNCIKLFAVTSSCYKLDSDITCREAYLLMNIT